VLSAPGGVAVDATRILVADTGHHRLRAVSGGVIATICGSGTAGFVGDGDLAAAAAVNLPGRMSFAGADLVFADAGNNRIRRLVSAFDVDPKLLVVAAKVSFAVDKKTGRLIRGRDSVSVKAGLALPAGINPANLAVRVDVVDLHQETQFDATGRQPKPTKRPAVSTAPFDFTLPAPPASPTSKYSLALKTVSSATGKPTAFTFSTVGTFGEELGRAGLADVTTAKTGAPTNVRVNITLGGVTFTGVAATLYKATQGKGGTVATVKPKP
jgi:hypothetical protein